MAGLRLILHIGGAKCGSSAIQDYLARNRTVLRQGGILVPGDKLDLDSAVSGQQIWFFETLVAQPDWQGALRRRLGRLAAAMERDRLTTLVLSAENLANRPEYAPAFAAAAKGIFAPEAICYIRRQDDYFISAWQQWKLKTHASFAEYLQKRAGRDADWHGLLGFWEEALGRPALHVRRFLRPALTGGDVVADFFDVLGLSQAGCTALDRAANRSLDEHLGDLAHRVRDLFDGPHDNELYAVMARLIGEPAYKSRASSHLMRIDEREALLARYASGNAAVKERYFPELGPDPLFPPPAAEEVASPSELDKLRAENALLMRAVFALAKRSDTGAAH